MWNVFEKYVVWFDILVDNVYFVEVDKGIKNLRKNNRNVIIIILK